MSITVPEPLRQSLLTRLVGLEIQGAMGATLVPMHILAQLPTQGTAGARAAEALRLAEQGQLGDAAEGPLAVLGRALHTYYAFEEGSQLTAFLLASREVAAAASGSLDPYAALRVGEFERLLLDHKVVRTLLRKTCDGPRSALWLSPPLLEASRACPDLVLHIGSARGKNVVTVSWQPGAALTPEALAARLGERFRSAAGVATVGAMPPRNTSDEAWYGLLAGWVVTSAQSTGRDTLLVLTGFRAPDAPEACLRLIGALLDQTVGANRPGPWVRLVLLGYEPDPLVSFTTSDVPRTALPEPSEAELREDARAALVAAGMEEADADAVLDAQWPAPASLDAVYREVSAILEVL